MVVLDSWEATICSWLAQGPGTLEWIWRALLSSAAWFGSLESRLGLGSTDLFRFVPDLLGEALLLVHCSPSGQQAGIPSGVNKQSARPKRT